MYCINCGVKLADSEKACPLCGTVPYHPDLIIKETAGLYPSGKMPYSKPSTVGIKVIVAVGFIIALLISFLCDIRLSGRVSWSFYVIGALLTAYITFVFPFWFKKPSPIIFLPLSFVAVGTYLLFINLFTKGDWFLSFAFPVVGIIGLLVTSVVILSIFFRRARLYIFGGAIVLLGGFMPLLELFLTISIDLKFIWWSLYPLVSLVLVGLTVLFFAISPTAREAFERKFFI